jgi:hypothetical protein
MLYLKQFLFHRNKFNFQMQVNLKCNVEQFDQSHEKVCEIMT